MNRPQPNSNSYATSTAPKDGKAHQRPIGRDAPRSKAPLSASAAHEINNPLDTLLNLLYLLESEPLSVKGHHYLSLAQEEVQRISQIARETLNHHKIVEMPERANVGELFAHVLDFYKQRFDAAGITVQAHYSSEEKIPVYEKRLRQVFSNLLLNAGEAMPEGGKIQARVSVGHEWSGQKRRGVRVTIADNGSGIPPHLLPQVFQRFFSTKATGSGMGLSLVSDVVQKHKGLLR